VSDIAAKNPETQRPFKHFILFVISLNGISCRAPIGPFDLCTSLWFNDSACRYDSMIVHELHYSRATISACDLRSLRKMRRDI